MSTEKTEGLVIRLADFSETSKVVTLFTHDHGKISTIAKGARRLKSAFEIALDLLTRCEIVFIHKSSGGLDILTEARLLSRFKPFQRNLSSLYGGYYVAELLNDLTEEGDPHRFLYEEACSTLQALAEGDSPRLRVLRFELTMLREIGQLPTFEACMGCDEPVNEQLAYALWVSQGGLICPDCRKDRYDPQATIMPPGTLAVLRKLADPDIDPGRLAISAEQIKQLRRVLTTAISYVLGRRSKLLPYL